MNPLGNKAAIAQTATQQRGEKPATPHRRHSRSSRLLARWTPVPPPPRQSRGYSFHVQGNPATPPPRHSRASGNPEKPRAAIAASFHALSLPLLRIRLAAAFAAALAALAFCPSFAHAALEARVDRAEVLPGETLTLFIRGTEGEEVSGIDLAPLNESFTVSGISNNTSFTVVNGKTNFVREMSASLLPKRAGTLSIPSFSLNGQSTRPLAVRVLEPGAASGGAGGGPEVFVEAELDRKFTRVQGQLIYRFRLFEASSFQQREHTPLNIEGAVVEELTVQTSQRIIDGLRYLVVEKSFAIFPQRSGTLEVPALTVTVRQRLGGGRTRTLQKITAPLSAEVRPIPANYPNADWLPLNQLKLSESWSAPLDELKPGESVTRAITLNAAGLSGDQLPELEVPSIPGLRLYPEPPQTETRRSNEGVAGIGTYNTVILAARSGEYELPPIRIPWWDTAADQLRYAELVGRRFRVAPGAGGAAGTGGGASSAGDSAAIDIDSGLSAHAPPAGLAGWRALFRVDWWPWLTLLCCIGWLATAVFFMRAPAWPRRVPPTAAEDPKEAALFREFKRQCRGKNPLACREALRRWGERAFNLPAKPTLRQLAALMDAPGIAEQFQSLDQALYAGDETASDGDGDAAADSGTPSWNPAPLLKQLSAHRRRAQETPASALPALN